MFLSTLRNSAFSIVFFLSLTNIYPGLCQGKLYFLTGIELSGLNYNYKFQQNGNILRRGSTWSDKSTNSGVGFSFNAALCYRISPKFTVETGFQLTEMDLNAYDNYFQHKNNSWTDPPDCYAGVVTDNGNFDFAYLYSSNYLSLYIFPGGNRSSVQFYLQPGIAYNYISPRYVNTSGTFTYLPPGSAGVITGSGAVGGSPSTAPENLQLNAHYAPHYVSEFLEAGLHFHGGTGASGNYGGGSGFYFGLRYYQAGNILSGDYKNVQNGTTLYTDHVTASGCYVAMTFRSGFTILRKDSKVFRPKKRSSDFLPLKIITRDSLTHAEINAQHDVSYNYIGGKAIHPLGGQYKINMKNTESLTLLVQTHAQGYFSKRDTLEVVGSNSRTLHGLTRTVFLQPVEHDQAFRKIYFVYATTQVVDTSFVALNNVYEMLRDNPRIHIRIEGYTAAGDEHRNLLLSHQRAKFVKNYLIQRGIDGDRVKTMGLGSSKAVFEKDTEENIARGRHTEIYITKD